MLMTCAEVCEKLRISRSTLDLIVKKGQLPCYKVGCQCRFKPEDVDTYLDGAKVQVRKPMAAPTALQPKRGRGRPASVPVGRVYVPGEKWIV